ncbi:MAG: hypothetical protein U9P80_08575, partial [Thermodesulfobacteriota bacterium]|nr:hypothetical protein [Thermodesulfobacteriota bacterium]
MKRLIPVFVVFLMILIGCDSNMLESLGDDSSREANLEEAQMALDDGNYDEAISILAPGYNPNAPDPVVARVLASAYMGKAGIDLTYLIENAGNSGSDGGAFDTIASALSVDVIIED